MDDCTHPFGCLCSRCQPQLDIWPKGSAVGLPRDPELRRAALAVITANARWLGSGAEDVEYEGLRKAMDALKEALAK